MSISTAGARTPTAAVTVWVEPHPGSSPYPAGMADAIRDALLSSEHALSVRVADPDRPDHGLGADVVAGTDVLLWWGHLRHADIPDDVVDAVQARVLDGMGLVVLHSGMESKIFRRLMGTSCAIGAWRHGSREVVWTASPGHPIAAGVPHPLVLPDSEMYCEPFDVPAPDDVVFVSGFDGGEVFRSGLTYRRGLGRVFYFSPGHEENAVYAVPGVRTVLANAAAWVAAPAGRPVATSSAVERQLGWYER